jgi:hypothetical protein
VHAALHPGKFEGSLRKGWLRPVEVARAEQCTTGSEDDVPKALDRLLTKLGRQAPTDGAHLDLEVNEALAHVDVAVGDFAGSSPRELRACAHACAAELLGAKASDHTLRWHLQRDERHLLICAIKSALLDAVLAIARSRHLRLRSIYPSFVPLWSRHGRDIGDAVFAVCDGSHTLVALCSGGVVTAVSQGSWTGKDRARGSPIAGGTTLRSKLDLHVDRLIASAGLEAVPAFLLACRCRVGGRPPVADRWTLIDTSAAVTA